MSAAALLTACGGGGGGSGASATDGNVSLASVSTGYIPNPITPIATTPLTAVPSTPASAAIALTDVRLENTGAAQTGVPFTFGQVFAQGQLLSTNGLSGRLDDGSTIALQVDVKATHADGSVRHAVISGILPSLAANTQRTVSLMKQTTATPATAVTLDKLMSAGFNFSVSTRINGVEYYASADELLKSATPAVWLKGSVANEWQVSAPLRTSAGATHPHLSARFAIRWYDGIKKARVDMTLENAWAFEPNPQNFTYDVTVNADNKVLYTKAAMTHLHHSRWRKLFWWNGSEPQVNIKHNTAYLIASRALPNYDQTTVPTESDLAGVARSWTGTEIEPMGVGLALPYMPTTGGRWDLGILPSWSSMYLLSMDARAKQVTLGTADLAGSWNMHYRDKKTDRPVSLANYPYMTVLGRYTDTYNPVTRQYEAFPGCASGASCDTPHWHDTSHQPGFTYLPYLVTGDYYYLEELQFWAMYNSFESNPNYRQNIKGLFQDSQVRGQAWSMRTAAEAAYITPDDDVLKTQLTAIVNNNLEWYNATYTTGAASTNALGVLTNGYAYSYMNGNGIAPWQDDFFTAAIGHVAELGFTKAQAILQWKAKFPILRMTAPGACWIDGAAYNLAIRASNSSPVFSTMAEVYTANHATDFLGLACASSSMATYLKLQVGEMTGYSSSAMGYPSNMQPALAYAADVGGAAGKQAWAQFMARSVKPGYSALPQFNIVPR